MGAADRSKPGVSGRVERRLGANRRSTPATAKNNQLTTYLPGRSEACVLEFATHSHSHVVTPEGIIAVVFTDRAGLELYDVNDCG